MDHLGRKLKVVRERRRLTLAEVSLLSKAFAQTHGSPQSEISSSWLRRIELYPKHEISGTRLIALLHIYAITLEDLLGIAVLESAKTSEDSPHPMRRFADTPSGVNPQGCHYEFLALGQENMGTPPERTHLLKLAKAVRGGRFLRLVIGTTDNYMHPILPAGTVALIDTTRRSIRAAQPTQTELQRPIYFVEHRDVDVCAWCEVIDPYENRAVAFPHPLSSAPVLPFVLGKDATIRGQVVAVHIPLELARTA